MRRYSDAQLTEAVRASRSWRGVLRSLGLTATSASAIRAARSSADRLGLDYSHFRGQRRWTDQQLAAAVAVSTDWSGVADRLGLTGGSSTASLRGHAVRLGVDTAHFDGPAKALSLVTDVRPELVHLRRAGSLLAAAWFELCGYRVSWPMEPSRYDLIVWMGAKAERIQVKTTTVKQGSSWTAWISTTSGERVPYGPDEIDRFFVIDGDFDYYLIPAAAVGGFMAIALSAYERYKLAREIDRGPGTHPV